MNVRDLGLYYQCYRYLSNKEALVQGGGRDPILTLAALISSLQPVNPGPKRAGSYRLCEDKEDLVQGGVVAPSEP